MNAYASKEVKKITGMIKATRIELEWCESEIDRLQSLPVGTMEDERERWKDLDETYKYQEQLNRRIAEGEKKIAGYESQEYAAQLRADDDDMLTLAW